MAQIERTCNTCGHKWIEGDKSLSCRRLPPSVTMIALPSSQIKISARGQQAIDIRPFCTYPPVRPSGLCGEWLDLRLIDEWFDGRTKEEEENEKG